MDSAAARTQDTKSSWGAPAGSPSITMSIRDSPIRTEETIAPGRALCAENAGANIPRQTQAAKIRTDRERAITSAKSVAQARSFQFDALGKQIVSPRFFYGFPAKRSSRLSTEILPAPKISTIRETIKKMKGAAAINLSGSEKKESSASWSPIT